MPGRRFLCISVSHKIPLIGLLRPYLRLSVPARRAETLKIKLITETIIPKSSKEITAKVIHSFIKNFRTDFAIRRL